MVFSDTYISESEAFSLLRAKATPLPTPYDAGFSETDLASQARESSAQDAPAGDGVDDDTPKISESYEMINVPPSRYLCSVPILAPPPARNQSETDLAKAEEARELSRASAEGWRLMNDLDGTCLYFMSGWWSYSFCYGKEIVQFHALPVGKNGGPPVRDPTSHEYILGKTTASTKGAAGRGSNQAAQQQRRQQAEEEEETAAAAAAGAATGAEARSIAPPNTELQVKGDQRYLVQRLDSGTVCDLTGRDRTIEIQYHCNPHASQDRIGWIKEVTTCTYLMVIQTPRLCAEVAFLPPKETRAHPISCRQIVSSDEETAEWHYRKQIEAKQLMGVTADGAKEARRGGEQDHAFSGMNIGGVVIGGHQVLGSDEDGQPAAKLLPPRYFAGGKTSGSTVIKVLASAKSQADGGEVTVLTDEELAEIGVSPETVEDLWQELQSIAGDRAWKLEVVDTPGQMPEIRGVWDDEGGEDEPEAAQDPPAAKDTAGGGSSDNKNKQAHNGGGQGRAKKEGKKNEKPKARDRAKEKDQDEDQGSEETFYKNDRDEL